MSTEEQRAIWRDKARDRRDRKNGATAAKANDAPEFLTVEVQETYVVSGGDGTAIALMRDELEQLFQWWKLKRKGK